MQNTSATYQEIVSGSHWFETALRIYTDSSNYQILYEDNIISAKISRPGMSDSKPSVGGALASTLDLEIVTPSFTIPRMAKIITYFKAVNSEEASGWFPSGTWWIDTRSVAAGDFSTTTITAFDAMMFGEQEYPDTVHSWPYLDKNVVAEIASTIGVTVDSRTNDFLSSAYMIELPADYTMREVLEHIAAMYCGNFVITAENKLLFVPLYGLEPEDSITGRYLKDEGSTDALQFGEEDWYILV